MADEIDEILAITCLSNMGGHDSGYAFYERLYRVGVDAEHSGDCKKQPWSCARCHADEAKEDAAAILAALQAAGFVIVPATSDLLRRGEGVKLHE